MLKLFVSCPAGVEELLRAELDALGMTGLKQTVTGVTGEADMSVVYRVCLWSRLANRVMLLLNVSRVGNTKALYDAVSTVRWQEHIAPLDSIRVDFSGTSDAIRHTLYGARVVKDAIVDQFTDRGLERPDVDLAKPMHRINVRLTPKSFYISLDLSGESLHKRQYRQGQGAAPIKENLAAALLLRAKWPELAREGANFVDPMCGSGTFIVEALMIAANIAPRMLRKDYGFINWRMHDQDLWEEVLSDAEKKKQYGLASLKSRFYGCEYEPSIANLARQNIANLKLVPINKEVGPVNVDIFTGELADSELALHESAGLILVNPPYGMRLGEADKLTADYFQLAEESKKRFPGWTLGILSSNPKLLGETRLRYEKKYRVLNGAIECEFRTYSLNTEIDGLKKKSRQIDDNVASGRLVPKPLNESAAMVANRLKKNLRKLKPWLQSAPVNCYRVYDADLPEYAAAIDFYDGRLHIQEYQAPKTVNEQKAAQRFDDLVSAAKSVFELSNKEVYLKTRRRNKGASQYEKFNDLDFSSHFEVYEGKAKLLVNLKSYLDSGLFLDHRPLRLKIAKQALGKSFLNLFCYTASASVHAALGGAKSSTSVDMSNTYLAWAKKNFERNNIQSGDHEFVRADVLKWLNQCRRGYDLIMLDPPSFSNSKKMDMSFDVQREHSFLVKRCMELLNAGGTLYFSNNLRKFKLDAALTEQFDVQNISHETIDVDFQRNQKIHHCFQIRHKA